MKKTAFIFFVFIGVFYIGNIHNTFASGMYFEVEGGFASQYDMPSNSDFNNQVSKYNQMRYVSVNGSRTSKLPLGFRISLGYNFPITKTISFGPNVGYGFYGQTTYHVSVKVGPYQRSRNLVYTSNGFDFSGRLTFQATKTVSVFSQAGVLFNMLSTDLSNTETTQALPLIGNGVAFKVSKLIHFTTTYYHGFGHAPEFNQGRSQAVQSPSFNAVFIGIQVGG